MSEVGCGQCLPVAKIELADGSGIQLFVCGHGGVRMVSDQADGHRVELASDEFNLRLYRNEEGAVVIDSGLTTGQVPWQEVPVSDTFLNGERLQGDVNDKIEDVDEALRRWL